MGKQPRKSRKPSIPIHMQTATGAETRVFPEDPDALELTIAEMFVHSIAQAWGRQIDDLQKNEPWPDFLAKEGTTLLGIEVAQIVDPEYVANQSRSQALANKALELVADIQDRLSGVCLEVAGEHGDPDLPKPGSLEFDEMAHELARLIRAMPPPSRWPLRRVLPYRGPLATRRPPAVLYAATLADPKGAFSLFFRGSYGTNVKKAVDSLTATLKGKIAKRYATFDGRLLLLLYNLEMLVLLEEASWAAAGRDVLDSEDHPFDEAWVFVPVTPSGGRPVPLWSRSSSAPV